LSIAKRGDAPVRIGILSTARVAAKRLVPAMRACQHAVVAGVASREAAKAHAAAAEFGCPAYTSYEAMLGDREIDGVYIPLPNALHAEWAVKAMKRGKMVLCEKPLVGSPGELAHLIRGVRETDGWLEETNQHRFHPLFAAACDWSRKSGGLRRLDVDFRFELNDADNVRWDPALGGGAALDLGVYGAALARGLAGAEPREARALDCRWHNANGGAVDKALVFELHFASGSIAKIDVAFDRDRICQWNAERHDNARMNNLCDFAWAARDIPGMEGPQQALELSDAHAEPGRIVHRPLQDSYTLMVDECASRWRAGLPPRYGVGDCAGTLLALWAALESARLGGVAVPVPSIAALANGTDMPFPSGQ